MAEAEPFSEVPVDVPLEVNEQVLTLMAEIGLSAALRGCGEAARPIFDALSLLKPENPLAAVGRALGQISEGRHEDAIAGLRASGANDAGSADELRAIMLLALCLAGHQTDAALLCRQLLNGGGGPSRQIALRLKPLIDAGLPTPAGGGG